jgi:hypothetical protein
VVPAPWHLGIVGKHAESMNLLAFIDQRTIQSWPTEKVEEALRVVRAAKALGAGLPTPASLLPLAVLLLCFLAALSIMPRS